MGADKDSGIIDLLNFKNDVHAPVKILWRNWDIRKFQYFTIKISTMQHISYSMETILSENICKYWFINFFQEM